MRARRLEPLHGQYMPLAVSRISIPNDNLGGFLPRKFFKSRTRISKLIGGSYPIYGNYLVSIQHIYVFKNSSTKFGLLT